MCPYYNRKDGHPMGARNNGHEYNAAAIPDALAEIVADEVHARFQELRIRKTPRVMLTDDEKKAFTTLMACGGGSTTTTTNGSSNYGGGSDDDDDDDDSSSMEAETY
jgi:hypothetical protein